MPEPASNFAVILRDIIIFLSVFASGVALWLAADNFRAWHRGGFPYGWAFVCARIGYGGAILLIAEALLKAPGVPPEWRVWAYIVFLGFALVGFMGVAKAQKHINRRI